MLDFEKPRHEFPYAIPFPNDVKSQNDWETFWTKVLEEPSINAMNGLASPRLMPFHWTVVLRRIRTLRKQKAERILFVANGVSLLPHFFSYGGIPNVDVVDVSEVAMEYCRNHPPTGEQRQILDNILLDYSIAKSDWNAEYEGLTFISASVFSFCPPQKYDSVFVYNFLEFFDDEDVAKILRVIHSLLKDGGTLFLGGLIFDGHYASKVGIERLHTLFSLFATSGFHFADQTALINEKRGALPWKERWNRRHIFHALANVKQASPKTIKLA